MQVPEAFAGQFGVMLFNRGSWCPYCNAQLGAFQRASAALADAGARVAALSVDDEAATAALKTGWRPAGENGTAAVRSG